MLLKFSISKFETGKVTVFFPTKGYGFATMADGTSVYFHLNNGGGIRAGDTKPTFAADIRPRDPIPAIGCHERDHIIFHREKNSRGFAATWWAFAPDFYIAQRKIEARKTYRAIKESGQFKHTFPDAEIWTGTDIQSVPTTVPKQTGGRQREGSGWFRYSWQVLQSGKWRPCDDPRTSFTPETEAKPTMPFTVAWRELIRATRNGHETHYTTFSNGTWSWEWLKWRIAEGKRGYRMATVVMAETSLYQATTFENDQANSLLDLGKLGEITKEEVDLDRASDYDPFCGCRFSDWECEF